MAKWPVTERTDVLPEGKSYRAPKKYGQQSFNEAMNPPNNPKKNHQPDTSGTLHLNVTDAYDSDVEE